MNRYEVTLEVWIDSEDRHFFKKIIASGEFDFEAENNAYEEYEQQLFRAGHKDGDFEIDICGCELAGNALQGGR